MKKTSNKKVDIVLPSRIGDSILSIPAAVCLKQLSRKYGDNLRVRVIAKPFLVKLLSSLELFECRGMNLAQKAESLVSPADRAFFIETTNDNFGFLSKENYGIKNPFKKFLKFSHQPEYLSFSFRPFPDTWEKIKNTFPPNLVSFLIKEIKLPWYSVCLFGICLELGYSAEQIIETYDHSELFASSDRILPGNINDDYVVFCTEAGYGRKHLDERCWDMDRYFEIAEKCAEKYGLKAFFVGMNTKIPLPDKKYIQDLRAKVDIYGLAQIMKGAKCYIGNDTGPMHVANLMKIRSVAVYFKDETIKGFSPLFPELSTPVLWPESIEAVYAEVEKVLKQKTFSNIS